MRARDPAARRQVRARHDRDRVRRGAGLRRAPHPHADRRAARRRVGDRGLHRLRPEPRGGPVPIKVQHGDRGRPDPLRPLGLAPGGRHVPQRRLRPRDVGRRRRDEDVLPRGAAQLGLLPGGRHRPRPGGHGGQRAVAGGGHRLLLGALREDHERDLRDLVADHARAGDRLLVQPRVPARRRPRRAHATDRPFFMWYDWMVGGWGGRNGRDGSNCTSPVFGVGLAVQPLEGQERLLARAHERPRDPRRLRRPGALPRRLRRREGRDADPGRAHRRLLLLRPRALDHVGHRRRPAVAARTACG